MNKQKSRILEKTKIAKVGLWKSFQISIEHKLNIEQKYYHDLFL